MADEKIKGRVVFHPDTEYEFDRTEYLDLKAQGLLVDDEKDNKTKPSANVSANKEGK